MWQCDICVRLDANKPGNRCHALMPLGNVLVTMFQSRVNLSLMLHIASILSE